MLTVKDLLLLVLRVLPAEIRESPNAQHNLPEKGEERSGTPDQCAGICALNKVGGQKGISGWPAGRNGCVMKSWKGGEVSFGLSEAGRGG